MGLEGTGPERLFFMLTHWKGEERKGTDGTGQERTGLAFLDRLHFVGGR